MSGCPGEIRVQPRVHAPHPRKAPSQTAIPGWLLISGPGKLGLGFYDIIPCTPGGFALAWLACYLRRLGKVAFPPEGRRSAGYDAAAADILPSWFGLRPLGERGRREHITRSTHKLVMDLPNQGAENFTGTCVASIASDVFDRFVRELFSEGVQSLPYTSCLALYIGSVLC